MRESKANIYNVFSTDIKYVHWQNDIDATRKDVFHVYIFDIRKIRKQISRSLLILNNSEINRASRFRNMQDRERFLAGRILVRMLLYKYTKLLPKEISILQDVYNKPYAISETKTVRMPYFNISHSSDIVLISISKAETGIDIEKIKNEYPEDIVGTVMSEEELEVIKKEARPNLTFYKFWTRKEALLKATGTGIIDDLNNISLCDGSGLLPQKFLIDHSYSIFSFIPSKGYIASVSYAGTITEKIDFIKINMDTLSI